MRELLVLALFTSTLLADAIDWSQTTSLPRPSWRHACAATARHIYFLGGGDGPVANCDYAVVNPDGTLGSWLSTTPMPASIGWLSADATGQHIYICGGWNGGGLTSVVCYAEFDSTGGIKPWIQTTGLPTALYTQGAILVDSCLYMVGGATGVGGPTVANVRYARVQPDGSLSAWTETSALPQPLRVMGVAMKDSWLYSVGGRNQGGSAVSSAYYARRNPDGSLGQWTATTSLPAAGDGVTCAVIGERIYLVGAGNLAEVYSAPVNPDGTLGNWVTETPIPAPRWASDGLAVNDRIYVTGGYVAGPNAEVYYSSPLTGIAEQPVTSRPSPFAIFPNPVRSGRAVLRLTLGTRSELPPNSVMSLRVLDASGRVLQSRILDPKSQIDLTLPAGVYLIRLDAGGFSANQKLVVQ